MSPLQWFHGQAATESPWRLQRLKKTRRLRGKECCLLSWQLWWHWAYWLQQPSSVSYNSWKQLLPPRTYAHITWHHVSIIEEEVWKMCIIQDRIKCHSLFISSTGQNTVMTCLLPFHFNVSLLFPAVKQLIDSKYFFCKRSVKFIPIDQACDGKDDCTGGEDEITCLSSFSINTTFPGKKQKTWLFLAVPTRTQKQSLKIEKEKMTPVFLLCVPLLPPVRLTSAQHVLQVYSPGSGWRSVCGDGWTQKHTETACKQLGYA